MAETKTDIRIETDRLILRSPRPEDAAEIHAGVNDFDVARMLARAPWPYRLEDAQGWLANRPAKDPAREQPLVVEHRKHGLIGMSGFHADAGDPFPVIGYWIARTHWGQGYASEATSSALVWAHKSWGKRAVRAGHFVENPASGRVLVKAGMLYTGEVSPTYCEARGEALLSRKMIWLA